MLTSIEINDYLIDNLRMDEDNLKSLDLKAMVEWLPDAPKKDSLQMMIKTITTL